MVERTVPRYPVTVEAHLDEPLSRWSWLYKWFLAIPHLVVLAVLWIGFAGATLAAGLAIAIFATRPLAMFLVSELHPTDPPTFLGVIGVLAAVAFAATLAPAVRAIRVDPMAALRSE